MGMWRSMPLEVVALGSSSPLTFMPLRSPNAALSISGATPNARATHFPPHRSPVFSVWQGLLEGRLAIGGQCRQTLTGGTDNQSFAVMRSGRVSLPMGLRLWVT